jgi:hypothetical protein
MYAKLKTSLSVAALLAFSAAALMALSAVASADEVSRQNASVTSLGADGH